MSAELAYSVPHLTTAESGPVLHLEQRLIETQVEIEGWFRRQWRETPAPLYCSVDLRNSGYKLAPVDTNLFPAGFNNLNPAFLPLCIQALQAGLERQPFDVRRVLLIPENHTRNLFYLESLATLRTIFLQAGLEVRIGSLLPDLDGPMDIELPSGRSVTLEPAVRAGSRLGLADFDPDLLISNNDLSGGVPEALGNLEQPLLPPTKLGWSSRLKSSHFGHYRDVAGEFSEVIDIDPWLIDPMFRNCGEVDFVSGAGGPCLTSKVDELLHEITAKYTKYGIASEPFIMVKADSGTYGMGVMRVQSVDDLTELNRKQRSRMAKTKEGKPIRNVIIQEGVYTHETWGEDGNVAEPVVYMIDHHVVGGFYRVHTERDSTENLNAPGMRFEPLAFADSCIEPDCNRGPDAQPNRFFAFGVIARLALVAAARELAVANGN